MPDDTILDELLADWPEDGPGDGEFDHESTAPGEADLASTADDPEKAPRSSGDPLTDCEAAIGYTFKDRSLLEQALIHASASATRHESNERLEFLGDAIFGAAVCEVLYEQFPRKCEGELTRIKSSVVSRATCAAMTRNTGLDRYVVVGKGVVSRTGRMPGSILAAVFEAIIAAVYLDAGYTAAADLVRRLTASHIADCSSPEDSENYKSLLQQRSQRDLGETPEYEVTDERGPDHLKAFCVIVRVGKETYPPAWGPNKKIAEQRAASNALSCLDGDPVPFPAVEDETA